MYGYFRVKIVVDKTKWSFWVYSGKNSPNVDRPNIDIPNCNVYIPYIIEIDMKKKIKLRLWWGMK